MKKAFLRKIVLTSLLIALNVIAERFLSYNVWNLSIGFSFVTVGFAAAFLGVPYAVCVAALGDVIGALLFPFGTYFVGFTATNAISGLIFGLFLRKNAGILKIFTGVLLSKVICSLGLNSLWIAILYRNGLDAYFAVMLTRLPTAAVMLVIETLVMWLLFSKESRFYRSVSRNITAV